MTQNPHNKRIIARRLRMCNEYATTLLHLMRGLYQWPIEPPLTINDYRYFAHYQKIAATMMSIIQLAIVDQPK